MVSLTVIVLCLLYVFLLAGVQLYLWRKAARDGVWPRWFVEESQVMACTAEEAFAFVGDPRNDVRHAPSVVAVLFDTPGGPRVGTTYRETLRLGPATSTIKCVITEYDPPRAIGLSCEVGRRSAFGGYRVAPHLAGCVVTALSGTTKRASGVLLAPFTRRLTRRMCRKDLDRIRTIVESLHRERDYTE
jgi:hypothetical protein